MIVFIVFGFAFIPFWNFISKYVMSKYGLIESNRLWGKRKAYLFSLIASVVGFALLAVPGVGQHWFALGAIAFAGMNGIFLTGSNFLYQSLQGDVMDYDELRTGMTVA